LFFKTNSEPVHFTAFPKDDGGVGSFKRKFALTGEYCRGRGCVGELHTGGDDALKYVHLFGLGSDVGR
jgi:hypothetical protein